MPSPQETRDQMVQDKPTYAAVSRPLLSRKPDVLVHRLTTVQPEKKGDVIVVSIPQDLYQKRMDEFKFALIGRLVLRKGDKPRTTHDLKQELTDIWRPTAPWQLVPMGKSFFSIKFQNPDDKALAKKKQMLELSKGSLRLREWTRNFDPYKELSSLWTPIKVDGASADGDVGHYARILVELDLALPIPESALVDCADSYFHVEFGFEQLPFYCNKCKITGHTIDKCRKNQKQEAVLKEAIAPKVVAETNMVKSTVGDSILVNGATTDGFHVAKHKNNWKPKAGSQLNSQTSNVHRNSFEALNQEPLDLDYAPDLLAAVTVHDPLLQMINSEDMSNGVGSGSKTESLDEEIIADIEPAVQMEVVRE
ncbi:uncharacterized protein LOC131009914 [Salvia miltiorrhiza]|uniref:uncharacterized protein LOC131009914 n=1 Tax=Salvia miltiorrhiza TaxID=226208 RepID=UPI0025AB6CE3|nr:uncharacterized protein LOC131009914 [Salvia miltiorrhiza]